jgi:hypothetical protein
MSTAEAFENEMKQADEAAEKKREEAADTAEKDPVKRRRHGRKGRLDAADEVREVKPAAPKGPVTSRFADLSASLRTAEDFSQYIRDNIASLTERQGGPRSVNMLLQLLSSRESRIYDEFFANYQAETLWVLDKLASSGGNRADVSSLSKTQKNAPKPKSNDRHGAPLDMSYAHEFVIRAQDNDTVRSAGAKYGQDANPISDSTPLPVLTAPDLIAEFISQGCEGHIIRRIQLCASLAEFGTCVAELEAATEPVAAAPSTISTSRVSE